MGVTVNDESLSGALPTGSPLAQAVVDTIKSAVNRVIAVLPVMTNLLKLKIDCRTHARRVSILPIMRILSISTGKTEHEAL